MNSDKWAEGLERVRHKKRDEQIQVEFVDGILLKSKQAITTHLYLTEQVSPIHAGIGTTQVIFVLSPSPLPAQMVDMDVDSFSADVAQLFALFYNQTSWELYRHSFISVRLVMIAWINNTVKMLTKPKESINKYNTFSSSAVLLFFTKSKVFFSTLGFGQHKSDKLCLTAITQGY